MVFVPADFIKELSKNVGFDDCGICDAAVDPKISESLNLWLDKSFNAGMKYMSENIEVRKNPQLLVENAKTIISVLLSYNTDEQIENQNLKIAKYALGRDYHFVVKEKLQTLLTEIQKLYPEVNGRVFVDSAPIFERYFAQKSGLGFIGRNSCLISPKFGSFVFIGEIVTDCESDYDKPLEQSCLNCNACIKFCPTKALTFTGTDANKCLSYQTIESKEPLNPDLRQKLKKNFFGCDICQDCCPHNFSSPKKSGIMLPEIKTFSPDELNTMSNRQFAKKYANTALLRAGRKKIVENIEGCCVC